MSLENCKQLADQYHASHTEANNFVGDSTLLASLKEAYDRLPPDEQHYFQIFILKKITGESIVYPMIGASVVGGVALPVLDAYCFGTPSLLRGLGLFAVGAFAGMGVVKKIDLASKSPAQNAREYLDGICYTKIEQHLKLDSVYQPPEISAIINHVDNNLHDKAVSIVRRRQRRH